MFVASFKPTNFEQIGDRRCDANVIKLNKFVQIAVSLRQLKINRSNDMHWIVWRKSGLS